MAGIFAGAMRVSGKPVPAQGASLARSLDFARDDKSAAAKSEQLASACARLDGEIVLRNFSATPAHASRRITAAANIGAMTVIERMDGDSLME